MPGRLILLSLVWLACQDTGVVVAQRLDWKLEHFKPLTELDWGENVDAPMEQVLTALYREPELQIRISLLQEYLHALPVEKLGQALDLCLRYEGTQQPDDLVEFFIAIWAKRDPAACLERVKQLIKVAGIEEGWLNYDGWRGRERIAAQDLPSLRASSFRLSSRAFSSFPHAVEESGLPGLQRTRYLKEFANVWLTAFGDWPSAPQRRYKAEELRLRDFFTGSPLGARQFIFGTERIETPVALQVLSRRYVQAVPSEAPKLVEHLENMRWADVNGENIPVPPAPWKTVYQVWAEADLAGMVRWVDAQAAKKVKDGLRTTEMVLVKGILMGRVDARKRQQWMNEVRKNEELDELLLSWAGFDPKAALDAAMLTRDAELIGDVVRYAAFGPQDGHPWNTSHPGMGVVRDYDFSVLPREFYRQVFEESGVAIMEQWGDLDVGEAARFGLNFLLKSDYVPREELTKLFSGDDEFASDADMIDRTFCALRIWAVTKPDEMKAWIATLKEEDLRKALTWLLENPWGTGPEE